MSKPIRREKPASCPVCAIPTTPPAGPERIASLPWNSSAAVRPPEDIMNIRRMWPAVLVPRGPAGSLSPCEAWRGGLGWGVLLAPEIEVRPPPPPPPPPPPGGGGGAGAAAPPPPPPPAAPPPQPPRTGPRDAAPHPPPPPRPRLSRAPP